MIELIRVREDNNLARDPTTGAIVMTNSSQFKNYVEKRNMHSERIKEIQRQSEEINSIKHDLCEIKSLLLSLITKE